MRKISKLLFVITALAFTLSFGVISNSPTTYATSGGGEGRCSDFSDASDREMCNDQYSECQAATGGNNCMERAVTYTQENGTQAAEDSPDVCTAGALGWVICPLAEAISGLNDMVYNMVEEMLIVKPVTVEINGPLYGTWTGFRDIANALFIIAFLIVVFSQATSIGLSSYGIKKMLPRIILSAILVNLSFYICVAAIEISNIVGISIADIFAQFRSGDEVNVDLISWENLIAGILGAGGAFAGVTVVLGTGGVAAAVVGILPFLVTALFAVITAIVVLIARQVLIILLVALAPLAFVAFILPNTQKYFQLWQNTLTTLLVMFPLVAMLFAGSQLAANIILTSSTENGGINLLSAVAAICVLFVPLFGVPYIVKFSGGTIGRIAGMVNNPNKGPFDKLRKQAEGYRDYKQNQAQIRNANGEFGKGVVGAARKKTFGAYNRRKFGIEAERQSTKRFADDATSGYVAEKSLENEKFAKRMAGGQYQGDNLSTAVTRVQASAVAHERDESRKRISSAQQLMSYREKGLDWKPMEAMYEAQYAEAAKKGDYETASAALKNMHVKGATGREAAANWLTKYAMDGPTQEAKEVARKEVERTVYEDMSLGARSDIVKGNMDVESGKWNLKPVGNLATKQIASLDADVLKNALVKEDGRSPAMVMQNVLDSNGKVKIDPQTGKNIQVETNQPVISVEQAREIISTPGLRQEVNDPGLIKLLETRAASGPSGGSSGRSTPPSGPAPSGGGAPSGSGPTSPSPGSGGNTGQLIIPRAAPQNPSPNTGPTPTQQQRQTGGNFGGGPAQNLPPVNPQNPPRNPPTPPTPPFNPPNNP